MYLRYEYAIAAIHIVCLDFDECLHGNHSCDVNADCVNLAGSYDCQCKDGYKTQKKGDPRTGKCISG